MIDGDGGHDDFSLFQPQAKLLKGRKNTRSGIVAGGRSRVRTGLLEHADLEFEIIRDPQPRLILYRKQNTDSSGVRKFPREFAHRYVPALTPPQPIVAFGPAANRLPSIAFANAQRTSAERQRVSRNCLVFTLNRQLETLRQ